MNSNWIKNVSQELFNCRKLKALLLISVIVVFNGSCGVAQVNGAKRQRATVQSTPKSSQLSYEDINRQTRFVPASEVEVMQVVRGMEASISKRDGAAFCAWFDNSTQLSRILTGTQTPAHVRAEFEAGSEKSGPFQQIGSQILRKGGGYQFLRLKQRNGEIRPVFRSIVPDTGIVNYNELVISKGTGRGPRVVDFYSAAAGDYLSLTSRSATIAEIIAGSAPGSVPTAGMDPEVVASAQLMQTMGVSLANGKYREVLAGMEQLPTGLQHEKAMLGFRYSIAKRVGQAEFRQSVANFVKYNPDPIACDLALLDLYRNEKNDEKIIEVIDRLLPAVQDPYLNYVKVQPLIRQNRFAEAQTAVATAKAAAPNRSEVFVSEIGLLMKLKNHAATAKAIEDTEKQFGDKVVKLTEFPEFNEFSESEAGMACLARRAGF